MKTIIQSLLYLAFSLPLITVYAHNKVVVIPMAGDDVEVGIHLDRTQIVGGSGTNTENGAALIQALEFVTSQSPSAADPWLIRLEPGIYNVGSQLVTLPGHIHLIGAGPTITEVISGGSSSAIDRLRIQGNTEISDIRLSNSTSSFGVVGITNSAKVRFHNVHIYKENPSGFNGTGIRVDDDAKVELITSKVTTLGGSVEGIFIESSSLEIVDSHVEAADAVAVFSCCQEALESATITIEGSKIIAAGGTNRTGVQVNALKTSLVVTGSYIQGSGAAAISSVGSKEVRSSTILGTVSGTGSEICVGISTSATFFSNTCP